MATFAWPKVDFWGKSKTIYTTEIFK